MFQDAVRIKQGLRLSLVLSLLCSVGVSGLALLIVVLLKLRVRYLVECPSLLMSLTLLPSLELRLWVWGKKTTEILTSYLEVNHRDTLCHFFRVNLDYLIVAVSSRFSLGKLIIFMLQPLEKNPLKKRMLFIKLTTEL